MKNLMPSLTKSVAEGNKSSDSYYKQLYDYIKREILVGNILAGEKLPSLRSLASSLEISLTTVEQAYNQLLVEGYIYSKPQSGYYVSDLSFAAKRNSDKILEKYNNDTHEDKDAFETMAIFDGHSLDELLFESAEKRIYDLETFDFNKWKKCTNKILTDYPSALTFESDPQGEEALRYEISKYLYLSRGVMCDMNQVVIGAGTQQITGHLARILSRLGINHVAVEEPGYLPVKNIFKERGFVMTPVNVKGDGIDLSALPMNIRSAVYVCPSNQFPTGAVMPIGNRYALLDWAEKNNSIIIEDDYDSELRYFGRPVPALQGLDRNECVVYLGSFSSTLFPAVKISYMVLTPSMVEIFSEMRSDYTQTCSKTEQLTLALFMEKGFYQTGLKKTRKLYGQKMEIIEKAVEKYGQGRIVMESASSGLNVVLRVMTAPEVTGQKDNTTSIENGELLANQGGVAKSAEILCEEAKALGLSAVPVSTYADKSRDSHEALVLYYNQIPLGEIEQRLKRLFASWLSPSAPKS